MNVTFPAFETEENDTACASILIIDDDQLEGDNQRFNVSIFAVTPSNVVSDGSMAVVRIEDNIQDGRSNWQPLVGAVQSCQY